MSIQQRWQAIIQLISEVQKDKAINLLEYLRSRFVYTAGKVTLRGLDRLRTVHSEQLDLVDGQRGHLDA